MGIDYAEHLISAIDRPADHYRDQPWGQVPVLRDGDVRMLESGAILLHLGERDERLLPRDPQGRATVTSWLFAAYSSGEPLMFESSNTHLFVAGEELDRLRRRGLMGIIALRLCPLPNAWGPLPWPARASRLPST